MEVVEPIRDLKKLQKFKKSLQKDSRNYLLAVFGMNTGLRIGDIIRLKVSDVRNKTHIVLKEKKTNKRQELLLNDVLKGLIKDFIREANLNDNDYLFKSRQGGSHIKRFRAYQIFNQAAREIGLTERIGCHSLRKSFGYHFYKKNKCIVTLMKIFNHSHQSITLRYIGLEQEAQDEAMNSFNL